MFIMFIHNGFMFILTKFNNNVFFKKEKKN